jgi:hypothetical protein
MFKKLCFTLKRPTQPRTNEQKNANASQIKIAATKKKKKNKTNCRTFYFALPHDIITTKIENL